MKFIITITPVQQQHCNKKRQTCRESVPRDLACPYIGTIYGGTQRSVEMTWHLFIFILNFMNTSWTLVERLISRWTKVLHSGNYRAIICVCICALVVYGSEGVTVALHGAFGISTEVVTALFGCYMAGATWNCCHLGQDLCPPYNHAPVYSVTLFEAAYVGRMCV